jgi:hypothetical protein
LKRHFKKQRKKEAYKNRSNMVLCPQMMWRLVEGEIMKQNTNLKKQAKANKADFIDWLLAIDASLT